MAAFTKAEEVTIPRTPEEGAAWGWEPHETVTLKGKLTVADVEAVSSVSINPEAGADGTPQVNTSTSTIKTMYQMITRWNLTDEQNRVAELSLRNIGMLPLHYVTPIMTEVDTISKRGQVSNPLPSSNSASEPTFQS